MTSVMPRKEPLPMPSDAELKKLNTKLAKARTGLILEHPFFGNIALGMPSSFDVSIPTACTNGKRVKYNPHFVAGLTDEEVKFLVAHECGHPMLEHNYRRGERQPKRWNMAADYVLNKVLTDEGIGRMPKGGLLDGSIYQAGGGTTEGIYNILPDQGEDGEDIGGDHGGGGPLDNCEDGEGSQAEQAQEQAEWKVKVAQAAQAAKMMGKLSANLQRLVDEVLQPKVDWRDVLYRFLVKARTDQRSFARFNRRFLPQGIYLPTVSGETMGELVFAVDCSGSIGQATINQFAAEIRTVKDDLSPAGIHVLYFDSDVSHVESYGPDDDLDIKPHGGGGTDFAPVFSKIVELGIEPVAIVFLTDLCCTSFGQQPDAPVLWVSTDPGTAPFGEVVLM